MARHAFRAAKVFFILKLLLINLGFDAVQVFGPTDGLYVPDYRWGCVRPLQGRGRNSSWPERFISPPPRRLPAFDAALDQAGVKPLGLEGIHHAVGDGPAAHAVEDDLPILVHLPRPVAHCRE
jgi:hypothetical protein